MKDKKFTRLGSIIIIAVFFLGPIIVPHTCTNNNSFPTLENSLRMSYSGTTYLNSGENVSQYVGYLEKSYMEITGDFIYYSVKCSHLSDLISVRAYRTPTYFHSIRYNDINEGLGFWYPLISDSYTIVFKNFNAPTTLTWEILVNIDPITDYYAFLKFIVPLILILSFIGVAIAISLIVLMRNLAKAKRNKVVTYKPIIKKTVKELGSRYGKLDISEIAEECLIKNNKILIKVIKEMINKKEIHAKYFSSTKTIAFDQQLNVQDNSKPKASEIVEHKKKCIVCKGDILHLTYECPQCKLKYHFKCANSLKNDGKGCFQCYESIPILPDIPEIIEISEKEKGEPIVVSLQNLSNELAGMLLPEERKHKDHTSNIIQIKRNLHDEMQHKVSQQFFDDFRDQIDELFDNILSLNVDDLKMLGQLKTDQRHMFYNIIERLKEVKGHCKNCGNNILNLNQKICEFCGLDLNKI